MCGILVTAGLGRAFSHYDLASLRTRGPDALGFWCDERVNIGQTRLAIIGLDERGIEPVENETHVLAFNGEIYNFEEIRRRLEQDNSPLPDANDAVVLLHAWSKWGRTILDDLHGFWAFVVYDKREHTLSLVRDQLGIKPLYYSAKDGRICIASMLRTILEVTEPSSVALDYEALSEYVAYQYTFGDKTFVRDIRKVAPGHIVEIKLPGGCVRTTCYEDIFEHDASIRAITPEWIDETRYLLGECVRESTVSDVPFTTLCSGGLDSSLLTRIAKPEVAYHCNFSDPECNETFFAREVIDGTRTHLFVVNATESFDLVARLASIIEDFDDLTIGSVILPLDDLLDRVRRRYKVLLTGTGGDELFGGYTRYQLALGECYQDSYRALFESMRHLETPAERFEACHRKGSTAYYRFYQPDVEKTFQTAYAAGRSTGDDCQAMLNFDRRYFLGGLLNIDDKMSARFSLESRPSLLHQDFVRHVRQVDPGVLVRNTELKWVLRQVATPFLPKSVIHRQDKMGFTTPVGDFVRHSSHLIREQLARSAFRDLYELKGLSLAPQDKFSRQVFGLLMIDLWLNRYAT
jgi:asparagine synthase (glutamine-hydrolysing)